MLRLVICFVLFLCETYRAEERKSVNLFAAAAVVAGVDIVGAAATSTLASSLLEFMLIFKRTHTHSHIHSQHTT